MFAMMLYDVSIAECTFAHLLCIDVLIASKHTHKI